ncbi:hypothetical protein BUALT_Bualt03G0091800 [Buddleja alternifolia]|uniref:DUF4371 domain-containing protein n=1 Tax=Buddleja alternifolia TaxID=168488 RepID=A0AAV6XZ12_9LAMI|nr:hypothetical protein BUALT_Bualt03G0091800 [Buddleja alternifolia]
MSNNKIDCYFKKRCSQDSTSSPILETSSTVISEASPTKVQKLDQDSNCLNIERDPGLRKPIWDYSIDERDKIRRAYLKAGPYQGIPKYSLQHVNRHGRRPSTKFGVNAFTSDGFQSWKRVNDGKICSFLIHEGSTPNSSHNKAVNQCHDLLNPLQHIERIIDKQSTKIVAKNRLRLKVSIDVVKLCAFQGIAFRARNERVDSHNRGNFIEILKHTASYNNEVSLAVLENAPQNASYHSPQIQKEILSIYARKIQKFIREEIGDAKYCLIVDESRNESKRKQMAIVLRFVDKDGFIRERFFDIVHVEDTKSSTLKKEISRTLAHHNLDIQNIRGQGYDGASNMRGEWNGLQALFLNECPYAYYVHCFAHRLQLILVATAQSVIPVEHFFSYVTVIVNLVDSSSKRHDQLQIAQAIRIEELTSTNELKTGRGKNQVGTVQRPGDTRWGSHLRSLRSLLGLFDSILLTLSEIINDKTGSSPKATADGAYDLMMSFEFVFILHFVIELLEMTDDLCEILQYKSQDILNAMDAVTNTKELIQKFRESGWDDLFDKVKIFCEKREIDIPDMSAPRRSGRGRLRKENPIILEHHYRVDIFTSTIDSILQEMNYRFDENAVELLRLSSALDPRDGYKSFNINEICTLVEKFYPKDFNDHENTAQ